MNFNSQICTTKEQSERLLALGLKKETADMVHQISGIGAYKCWDKCDIKDDFYPAWSLHRLLLLFPTEYIYDIDFQRITHDFIFGSQDMYDEAIGCIEALIEGGYFYEEYLEK